ncbi:MAG: RidA family protein [Pseudomonadota bacterium]
MSDVETRLAALGLTLPTPAAPVASYLPYTIANGMLFVSGQLPFVEGELVTGTLGIDVEIEAGIEAAQACGLGLLAQAKAACDGDLGRLDRCIKLGGFVACAPDFQDQPKVINGTSDLMFEALGEAGRHARAAVGAPALPLGAVVEVDGIFTLRN